MANQIFGTNNDDTLTDNDANTRSTLIGGAGSDLYLIEFPSNIANLDQIQEDVGGGTDAVVLTSVVASVTYQLQANVENLQTSNVSGLFNANIIGNVLNNNIATLDGNDTLDGGAGDDALSGGNGNDLYIVDSAKDVVIDNGGIDTVQSSATYTLSANIEVLKLTGAANISGTANALDNTMLGNSGNNQLSGLAGNDTLDGGLGNDTLLGGDGNDLVQDTQGSNSFDGGAGNDTLIGGAGKDTLSGGAGNDSLNGSNDSVIDSLVGGVGNDIYQVFGTQDMIVEAAAGGTDTILINLANPNDTYVLSANVENGTLLPRSGVTGQTNLTGNASDNILLGNADDNLLIGLAGNDVLNGGVGDDTMLGGDGNDIYVVDTAFDVVTETNSTSAGGVDTVSSEVNYTLGANLENLVLAQGGVGTIGRGNSLANKITGNTLNNVLYGMAGNDTLDGMGGTDVLQGGTGNDTYIVHSASDIVIEVAETGANSANGKADKIVFASDYTPPNLSVLPYQLASQVENLDASAYSGSVYVVGNQASNSIVTGAGNDTLVGGANDLTTGDTLAGGAGNDTYYVDAAKDTITEALGGGLDTVVISVAGFNMATNAINVENAIMSTGTNTLTGNALDNAITGNEGANSIAGGDGNDSIYGAYGKDTLSGGNGNDTLDGGAGADVLDGGAGNDLYLLGTGDSILADSAGLDTIKTALSAIDMRLVGTFGAGILAIDNLIYTGSVAWTATGNDLKNSIVGGAANDILSGGKGDDTLDGGAGNDSLIGGVGNDTYLVDSFDPNNPTDVSGSDVVLEDAGVANGKDTVIASVDGYTLADNVENLILTANIITLNANTFTTSTGNASDNTITGNDQDNSIEGGDGKDTLIGGAGDDNLNGGLGDDSLVGGLGNDVYFIDSSKDVVSELANGGVDKVLVTGSATFVTYTLAANVESAELDNDLILTLSGNVLDNELIGNLANNTISGADGNDTITGLDGNDSLLGGNGNDNLDGGAGNDTMVGGAGDDNYLVDSASDLVTELTHGGFDTVQYITNSTTQQTLADNIEQATTAPDISNINLLGNALDNTLAAGFSTGNATLNGGAGNDTLTFSFNDNEVFNFNATGGDGNDTVNLQYNASSASVNSVTESFSSVENINVLAGGDGTHTITLDLNGFDTVTASVTPTHHLVVSGDDNDSKVDSALTLNAFGKSTDLALENYNPNTAGLTISSTWANTDFLNVSLQNTNTKLTLSNPALPSGSTFALNINSIASAASDTNVINASFNTANAKLNVTGDASLTLDGLASATKIVTTDYSGQNLTLKITDAGNKIVDLTLNNTSSSLVTSNVAQVNLHTKATTFAAGNALDLTDTATHAVTKFVVDGEGSLVLTDVSNTTVDASALTGSLSLLATGNTGMDIQSGTADDFIQGSNGNDTINAGAGNDALYGLTGSDTFVFSNFGAGVDTLYDFTSGADKISLSSSLTGLGAGALVLNTNFYIGQDLETTSASSASVFYDTKTGGLYYDANGGSTDDAVLFGQIANGNSASVVAGDFIVT